MKKMTTVIATITFIGLTVGLTGLIGGLVSHYNREAIVTNINDDEITVVDYSDNVWCFYGEGYTVGDSVTMKMFTNNTDGNIYDDVIVKVKVNN